jgi:hypothetical protein
MKRAPKKLQNTKINAIKNQRTLRQKCNLNDIFHEGKGQVATGKMALLKTWGVLAPLPPSIPTPLLMCMYMKEFENLTVCSIV